MRRNNLVILLFFLLTVFAKSQDIVLTDFTKYDYYRERNCRQVPNCIDSINFSGGDYFISFVLKDPNTYKPERILKYELALDTFEISYRSYPVTRDSMVFNKETNRYDKLKIIEPCEISIPYYNSKHPCRLYHFKFNNFPNPPGVVKYNNKILKTCPTTYISYSIHNGDTIDIINQLGYIEGKWYEFYETGEIRKMKEYNNGHFIKGYLYNKEGKATHSLSETNIEMATPIDKTQSYETH